MPKCLKLPEVEIASACLFVCLFISQRIYFIFAHLIYTKLDSLRGVEELSLGKDTRCGNDEEPKDLRYILKLKCYFLEHAEGSNQGFIHFVTFFQGILTNSSVN